VKSLFSVSVHEPLGSYFPSNSNMAVVLALAAIAYLVVNSSEPYTAPQSSPTRLTEQMISDFIQVTKGQLVKQLGYPVQPVSTEYVTPNGNNFDCRFIFAGFSPKGTGIYSLGVSATFSPDANLVGSLKFQSDSTIDQMDAFDGFQSGSLVTKQDLPTISQLRAAFQS
jgi:hypothetical protein